MDVRVGKNKIYFWCKGKGTTEDHKKLTLLRGTTVREIHGVPNTAYCCFEITTKYWKRLI